MKKTASRRRGFTLIELLAAIAIIGLLAAMSLGIYQFVQVNQKESVARGDILLLANKLEEFKSRYGEYPMAESGSETDWQKVLYNSLTGRWVYRKTTGADGKTILVWDKSLEGGNESRRKPLVAGEVGTDATEERDATRFMDPWGNAYRYRYGRLTSGKVDRTWDRPGVLIISAGEKKSVETQAEIDGGELPEKEFFQLNESVDGIVPDTYFDDEHRADNLTNFAR